MVLLQRVVKPKTQKGRRHLEARASKVIENNKTTMVLRGGKTSQNVIDSLKDLYHMKKPDAVLFSKKNEFRPFEDQTPLERLSEKHDCSLFLFGSHSKKRPNNIVIGRTYDHQILDMFELGADNYKSLNSFKNFKMTLGSKPCLVFSGADWDSSPEYQRLKNLLVDFFRGPVVEKIRLIGLEHAVTFTLSEGHIFTRSYRILLKKSGSRIPRVELEEIGPAFDLIVRRHKIASEALFREALRVPRTVKPKKKKNVSHDTLGSKLARVHMQKQDLKKLQLRKVKALKRGRTPKTKITENTKLPADLGVDAQ